MPAIEAAHSTSMPLTHRFREQGLGPPAAPTRDFQHQKYLRQPPTKCRSSGDA